MPVAQMRFTLPLSPAEFPFLAGNTLRRLGYNIPAASSLYKQISAARKQQIPGRADWTCNFNLLIRWKSAGSHVNVVLRVEDQTSLWSQSYLEEEVDYVISSI